jgi:hypothetical protein
VAKGLYRDDVPSLGECVFMDWGNVRAASHLFTRGAYELNGYQPPYERLPTRAEYVAANVGGTVPRVDR